MEPDFLLENMVWVLHRFVKSLQLDTEGPWLCVRNENPTPTKPV